jgi:hypothetical protein
MHTGALSMAGRAGTSELTADDLAVVQSKAWNARSKWYNIGLQLGLKADDLDCIHGPDSFTEMLKQWLRQESIEKTWDKLIKALQSEPVNYGALATSIATQGELATNWVSDHDSTEAPEHCNGSSLSNATKLNDNQQSNQYADHSAEHDQYTMFKSLAIQKPKQRGFICPCGRCSIEQFLETGCPQSPSNAYPFLDTKNLTDHERYELIFKLNEETKSILSEFSNLINHMIKSFKEQKVEPQDIRSSVLSCAPHCSGILKGTKTINEIIDALVENGYLSFVNYHIAKHLIKQQSIGNASCGLTTMTDHRALEIYETKFYQFCKRSVFEVPQGVFARNPLDGEILVFKVTSEMAKSDFNTDRPLPSTLETSSKVLNLTLEDTIMIQGRISTSLGLKNKWSLIFLRASMGCIELNFSISTFLFQELKPQLNVTEATELNRKTGIASLEASGIHLLCGPPGKPYVSEVTNDSVTLKWSKPEYTGLHPPTGYRIYCRSTTDRPDSSKWIMSTEGPVESLVVRTPSTDKGSFIVQAMNEIGPGVTSEESNLMITTLTPEHGIPSSLVSCYPARMHKG